MAIYSDGSDMMNNLVGNGQDSRPDSDEFLLGVGISIYQNSGCGGAETNWSDFGTRKGDRIAFAH